MCPCLVRDFVCVIYVVYVLFDCGDAGVYFVVVCFEFPFCDFFDVVFVGLPQSLNVRYVAVYSFNSDSSYLLLEYYSSVCNSGEDSRVIS